MRDGLSDISPTVAERDVLSDSLTDYSSPPQSLLLVAAPSISSPPGDHPQDDSQDFASPALNSSDRNASELHPSSEPSPSTAQGQSPPSSITLSQPASPSPVSLPHACYICHELLDDADRLIDHLENRHPDETFPRSKKPSYTCGGARCKRFNIDNRKDFRRHLTKTRAHPGAPFRCRCGREFPRKENCKNHLARKLGCARLPSFVCFCGHTETDDAKFLDHISLCGKGKRGRPPKKK